jgi:hypothetical protein
MAAWIARADASCCGMGARRIGLWWMFGIVGLIGGWLTAQAWGFGAEPWSLDLVLAAITAVVAALLGAACEALMRDERLDGGVRRARGRRRQRHAPGARAG